ncbi:DUF6438 domain-containing protein [Gracilibacillus sp. HCP3S3_G5_1]|uniref:DUF6438 domain-containing protein n=1 Tax=unclassified Gracilibacillus TaxID=2625209 RepID=UPI003F8C803C
MFEKIIFSRSSGDGGCPEFDVFVHNKGEAKWFGSRYVHHYGEKVFYIDQRRLQQLDEKLQLFNFRHFTYPTAAISTPGQSSCTIWVKFEDGFVKEVEHYLGDGARQGTKDAQDFQELEQFEKEIEEILGLRKFISLTKRS